MFTIQHFFRSGRTPLMKRQHRESTILWTSLMEIRWTTLHRKLGRVCHRVWAFSRLRAKGRLPTIESSFWTIYRNVKFPADTLNQTQYSVSVVSISHLLIIFNTLCRLILYFSRQNELASLSSRNIQITSLGKLQHFCTQEICRLSAEIRVISLHSWAPGHLCHNSTSSEFQNDEDITWWDFRTLLETQSKTVQCQCAGPGHGTTRWEDHKESQQNSKHWKLVRFYTEI